MSMHNDSDTNEKLISLIKDNLNHRPDNKKVSCLYHTILNNTCLDSLTSYQKYTLQTTEESIAHYGCKNPLLTYRYKDHEKDLAVALYELRKIMPYNTAKFLVKCPDNDTLYHVINDFKYKLNSNWFTMFNLER